MNDCRCINGLRCRPACRGGEVVVGLIQVQAVMFRSRAGSSHVTCTLIMQQMHGACCPRLPHTWNNHCCVPPSPCKSPWGAVPALLIALAVNLRCSEPPQMPPPGQLQTSRSLVDTHSHMLQATTSGRRDQPGLGLVIQATIAKASLHPPSTSHPPPYRSGAGKGSIGGERNI